MAPPLLIVGASGRAAAASARRAGFAPHVVDLFADADTRRIATVQQCPLNEYPNSIITLARNAPADAPFIYTGGLENEPDVISALQAERELWGNAPEQFARARSPLAFYDLLTEAGFRVPRTTATPPDAHDANWLLKRASSGGFGTRRATADSVLEPGEVWQQFILGVPCSAVFASSRQCVDILGITQQFVGDSWLHSPEFRYCGNISIFLPRVAIVELKRLAAYLQLELALVGIWGIDFIHNLNGIWFLELNPRFVASVEVLERVHKFNAIKCFLSGEFESVKVSINLVCAKAIYYAPHDMVFPQHGPWNESLASCTDMMLMPTYADIPIAGSSIAAGMPVLTLLVETQTRAECFVELKRRAIELDDLFSL